ncbi:DUF6807 family protein [Streptomyces griseolus]|uniref:DUF6807 family protein n=1 Tax=Streptomyces griseolus TaxID=1909 RepID=UPI00224480B4|nr:DUF6807 family protein [Streptomyces griseolus]
MTDMPAPATTPLPIVLAGARGHGRWHLANIRRLQHQGLVRLAGVCELAPLTDGELAPFAGEMPEQSADFGALLDSTGARAAVICTPIPTHTALALTAAARGVHLLLEKPPAATWADYARMADGVREAGIACQVGFQSFGSHAVPAIKELVRSGALGALRGVGAAGAWVRDDAYYRRAPWAGRRRLGGTDVVDGVLTNPLAHAVATALALADRDTAQDVASVETELFRAHDIEADDTSCVRITATDGLPVTAAVTLCAEQAGEPYVIVHGERGRVTFWYKQDRVLVQRAGHGPEEAVHGRTADWLALAGDGWTLVFAGATEETRRDPWFTRTTEYPGVGSCLAAERRLPVPAGATVVRRVVTVVADGRLDRDTAAALARKVATA